MNDWQYWTVDWALAHWWIIHDLANTADAWMAILAGILWLGPKLGMIIALTPIKERKQWK